MKIKSRNAVKISWKRANELADAVQKLDGLDNDKKSRYATLFILASATGLRCSELYALRMDDVDFKGATIRVDESFDGLTYQIQECKNVAAYRTVFLGDTEGRKALRVLKAYVRNRVQNPIAFLFQTKQGSPLLASNVLSEALHPALKALGLPRTGMHAFRRGCNQRWQLAGMNPAVQQNMMGHSSPAMTDLYSGELSLTQIRADFARRNGPKIVVMENKEKRAGCVIVNVLLEREKGIEPSPIAWEAIVLPLNYSRFYDLRGDSHQTLTVKSGLCLQVPFYLKLSPSRRCVFLAVGAATRSTRFIALRTSTVSTILYLI